MKHWTKIPNQNNTGFLILETQSDGVHVPVSVNITHDDANLMSAAPDMLAALTLILRDDKLMNAMSKDQARAIMQATIKAQC